MCRCLRCKVVGFGWAWKSFACRDGNIKWLGVLCAGERKREREITGVVLGL